MERRANLTTVPQRTQIIRAGCKFVSIVTTHAVCGSVHFEQRTTVSSDGMWSTQPCCLNGRLVGISSTRTDRDASTITSINRRSTMLVTRSEGMSMLVDAVPTKSGDTTLTTNISPVSKVGIDHNP